MESIKTWHKKAKCIGQDVADFFPEMNTGTKGKRSCSQCPVKGDCMTYAIAHDEDGIWGGTYRRERKKLGREMIEGIRMAYFQCGLLEYRPGDVEYFLKRQGVQLQDNNVPTDDCTPDEDPILDPFPQAV